MANHKSEWSLDDEVLSRIKFPYVSESKRFIPLLSEANIIGGNNGIKTKYGSSGYKYRCVDCGKYYSENKKHTCKIKEIEKAKNK